MPPDILGGNYILYVYWLVKTCTASISDVGHALLGLPLIIGNEFGLPGLNAGVTKSLAFQCRLWTIKHCRVGLEKWPLERQGTRREEEKNAYLFRL